MKRQTNIRKVSNVLAAFSIVALLSLLVPAGVVQAATRFVLARTILSPTPTGGGFFGEATGVVGDMFIVGARGECAPTCGGAVHLFDSDGNLVRTIGTPSPFASFGTSAGAVGPNPLVGAIHDSAAGSNAGAAYLFDGVNGTLLQTFLNPAPAPDASGGLDFFGHAVAGFGDDALVAAPGEDLGAQDAGVVYLFDGATGALLQTLQKPNPVAFDQFGVSVATVGNNIAVAAAFDATAATNGGAVYLFDGSGNLLQTIVSPRPVEFGQFGAAMAAFGDDLLVSEERGFTGDLRAGVVHLFDGATGAFIRSYFNPTPKAFELFGNSLAASGNNVLVGALRNQKGQISGAAYLFDGTTAELITTVLNPQRSVTDSFAWSVAAIGDSLLVGSPFQTSDPAQFFDDGAAYLFQPR
jgi:FG-GAP repeat